MNRTMAAISILGLSMPTMAHEYVTLDEFNAGFGIDLAKTEITTETVAPASMYFLVLAGMSLRQSASKAY
jgi:hypothetical protein